MKIAVCATVLGVGLLPGALAAQGVENYTAVTDQRLKNPERANWLMTRGNYQGWSYSPLSQITSDNVAEFTSPETDPADFECDNVFNRVAGPLS